VTIGFGYLRSIAELHTVVQAIGSYAQSYISGCCFLREMALASVGLCANRGAADEKPVLIHDVQSYVYTIASPAAVVLAKAEPMVAC
jgi:hypothetical protein